MSDSIVTAVQADLSGRAARGLAKYGTDMDRIEAIAQKHADYYDEPLGMHTRQLVAVEIEAAREEGRRAGMVEERMRCIQLVRDEQEFPSATHNDVAPVVQRAIAEGAAQVVIQWAAHKTKECILSAIEAKDKEG